MRRLAYSFYSWSKKQGGNKENKFFCTHFFRFLRKTLTLGKKSGNLAMSDFFPLVFLSGHKKNATFA